MPLFRTLRTVRHLKPEQWWGQVRVRLARPFSDPARIRVRQVPWRLADSPRRLDLSDPTPPHDPAGLARGRFCFLGECRDLGRPVDWAATGMPRLWAYNLHYFDWLWSLLTPEQIVAGTVPVPSANVAGTLRVPSANVASTLRVPSASKEGYGTRSVPTTSTIPPSDWSTARALTLDWIERHRPAKDACGWEPYPMSLRLINWSLLYGVRYRSQLIEDAEFYQTLLDSVRHQTHWLSRNLETHIRANHLLENLASLLCVASVFRWDGRDGLLRRVLPRFAGEVDEQILRDGMHYERSPMYHLRMLWLVEMLRCVTEPVQRGGGEGTESSRHSPCAVRPERTDPISRKTLASGASPPDDSPSRGSKATESDDSESRPTVACDSDDTSPSPLPQRVLPEPFASGEKSPRTRWGRRVGGGACAVREIVSHLHQPMVQALTHLRHPDGGISLLNDAAEGIYHDAWKARAPAGVWALPDAGYYGYRTSEGDFLVVDAGPIGPDHQPGHAHADFFSFELSLNGQRVITDTGIGTYEAGTMRAYDRSTAAHSTIEVDGEDSAEVWGTFRVGRRTCPQILKWSPRANGMELVAEHRGYAHLPCRAVHRRRIRWHSRELAITDQVIVRSTAGVVSRIHLAPDVSAEVGGSRVVCRTPGVDFSIDVDPGMDVSVTEAPCHPTFGENRRRKVVEIRTMAEPPQAEWTVRITSAATR